MKSRAVKFIAITSGIILVVILGLILLTLSALPSASQIGSALRSPKPSAPTETTVKADNINNTEAEKSTSEEGPTTTVAESKSENDQDANITKEQLLDVLTDANKPLSTVCVHITKIDQTQNTKISGKEFGQRFELSLQERSHDPLLESVGSILKFTFTRPTIIELMNEIKNTDLKKEDADSWMQKASFYNKALQAYRELVNEKPQMEKIVDQGYLLMMLGRAVETKPELRNEARLQDYCEQLESGLNTKQFPDFTKSKQAFLEFLSETGIDANTIGFNPNYKTELKYELGAKGLHFSGGWLDEIFAKPTAKN